MSGEKRRYSRYTVESAGVNAITTFNTEIEINNISVGGASVSCTRRLGIGNRYLFKFEHKGKMISVRGEVAWAKLTGSSRISEDEAVPIYTFGIRFIDSEEKAAELEGFVADELGDVRERRLKKVRVRIHAPERASVLSMENCAVIEMGLGGMRVEMAESPPPGTMLTLEIFVTESERPIECGGRVAFSNAVGGSPSNNIYSVGIEFTYIFDKDKARLERFIESLPHSK